MLKSAPGDARTVVAQFAAVLDRAEVRTELDRLARAEWGWGTPREVRTHVLKAHRRRCTFDVAVRTERGWHAVIGKIHSVDRSDVFRVMDAVGRAGFGPEAEYSIPRALLYLPSIHVLLEEKVPGPAAMSVFLDGHSDQHAAVAEVCGRWLARFHTAAPRIGTPVDIADEVARIRHWAERIAAFGGALAAKAKVLRERLEAAAPPPGAAGYHAGHGSYMPEHVMLGGPRVSAIDLDEFDLADPGRDLAWFVVSLQRLALKQWGSLHALDAAVDRFLQTYTAEGDADRAANLPFYRAMECLHRARRDLVKRRPPVPAWAEIMLDEGLHLSP